LARGFGYLILEQEMDLSVIKEIGSAFLVGATVMVIWEAYLFFCAGWTVTGLLRFAGEVNLKPKDPTRTTSEVSGLQISLYVALATMLGLLCQSVFQPFIDEAAYPFSAVPRLLYKGISASCKNKVGDDGVGQKAFCFQPPRSREGLRLKVLYEPARDGSLELTSLARRIVERDLVRRYCADVATSPLASEGSTTTRLKLLAADLADSKPKPCLNQLYETAKSWVYRQPTFYDELERLQSRIDFAGAFSFVTLALLPWSFAFLGATFAVRTWSSKTSVPGTNLGNLGSLARRVLPPLLIFAVGVIIMWLFDRFVLGYGEEADQLPYLAGFWFALLCGGAALVNISIITRRLPPPRKSITHVSALAALLLACHVAGYYAYSWETQRLSERVYGYFANHDLVDVVGSMR
jgi:hypothetical protein